MDIFTVLEHFKIMAGLTDEDAVREIPLCAIALAKLMTRLDYGVDVNKNATVLNAAAASDAYYNYILSLATRENTSTFSAGDVTVKQDHKNAIAAAKELRDNCEEAVAHLLADRIFAVSAVETI